MTVNPASRGGQAIVQGYEPMMDFNHPVLCQSNQRIHARLRAALHGAMFVQQRQARVQVRRVTQWRYGQTSVRDARPKAIRHNSVLSGQRRGATVLRAAKRLFSLNSISRLIQERTSDKEFLFNPGQQAAPGNRREGFVHDEFCSSFARRIRHRRDGGWRSAIMERKRASRSFCWRPNHSEPRRSS